jgi:acylphosphatase
VPQNECAIIRAWTRAFGNYSSIRPSHGLPDGRVGILACGEDQAVQAFIKWLWIGSSASKVTSVEVTEEHATAAQGHAGFRSA